MHVDKEDTETRDRIIQVAGELFADHGYHQVSARKICQEAEANHAAINYYFRNKLNLYKEVLFTSYQKLAELAPMPEIEARRSDPEEALKEWISWYMRRLILSPETRNTWRLVGRELHDPSELFDELVDKFLGPVFFTLEKIIAAAAEGCDPPQIRRLTLSIISQCLIFLIGRPMVNRLLEDDTAIEDQVETIAADIATLSLRGLEGLRR